MGIVLFIGVGTCFLETVIVIPVLIGMLKKNNNLNLVN